MHNDRDSLLFTFTSIALNIFLNITVSLQKILPCRRCAHSNCDFESWMTFSSFDNMDDRELQNFLDHLNNLRLIINQREFLGVCHFGMLKQQDRTEDSKHLLVQDTLRSSRIRLQCTVDIERRYRLETNLCLNGYPEKTITKRTRESRNDEIWLGRSLLERVPWDQAHTKVIRKEA